MTRSQLTQRMIELFPHLHPHAVAGAVTQLLKVIEESLHQKKRIEIRGFGVFTSHNKPRHSARNPQNNKPIMVKAKTVVRFKVSLVLKKAINAVSV